MYRERMSINKRTLQYNRLCSLSETSVDKKASITIAIATRRTARARFTAMHLLRRHDNEEALLGWRLNVVFWDRLADSRKYIDNR